MYGFELAKISIVIHLGMNPVSGGNPPKDKSRSGIIDWRIGAFEINLFIVILWDIENLWKIIKIGVIKAE